MGRTDVADRDDALPGTLCRAIVEASPLAMAVFRLPQLVAVDANTAFGLLTGIDRSELTGAGWADLPIWEHPEQADRQLLGATGVRCDTSTRI